MSLPPNLTITELTNEPLSNPTCTSTDTTWTVSYAVGQDFKIEVELPDAKPGEVYGLNQTQYLSIRTGIYSTANDNIDTNDTDNKDKPTQPRIQLWRTPPQTSPTFDFKGSWLDSNPSTSPYFSPESITTIPSPVSTPHNPTLRIHKVPLVTLPTHLRHKSHPERTLDIKQLDIQDGYLITLYNSSNPTPLAHWTWEYKVAFTPSATGTPEFVSYPYFAQRCEAGRKGHPNLTGPSLGVGGRTDHFRVMNGGGRVGMGEVCEWTSLVTEEWEACD